MSTRGILHWMLTFGLAALLAICYMQKNQAQAALNAAPQQVIVAVESGYVNSYADKTGVVKFYRPKAQYTIHARESCKALPAGTKYYTSINGMWESKTASWTTTICRAAPTG